MAILPPHEIYLSRFYLKRPLNILLMLGRVPENRVHGYTRNQYELSVNQETSEKSAEISKSWLQVWIPPTKIFKTAKIT